MKTFTLLQEINAARRSVKTKYVITGSEKTDEFGHTSVAVLEVTTIHSKERKAFYSSTVRNRTHQDGMFTVGNYDLMEESPIQRGTTPAARYSAKALEEAHKHYMGFVAPRIEVALDWAAAKEI